MDQARTIFNDLYDSVDWEVKEPALAYKIVIFDTLGELAKLDMREIMAAANQANPNQNKYVPSPREYLINGERIREIVRSYRDLPCHTIFFCHSEEREDNLKRKCFLPQFTGRMRHEIAGFVDVVGYMKVETEKDNVIRLLQTTKTATVAAKDRFDALGGLMEDPTISKIMTAIKEAA